MMPQTKFKIGDKVCCLRKRNTGGYTENYTHVEVGEVYTVAPSQRFDGDDEMTLVEINNKHPGGLYFVVHDFELTTISVITEDADDAWNRAMSIL